MSENGLPVNEPVENNSDNSLTAESGVEEAQVQKDSSKENPKSFEKRINKMYGENARLAEENQKLSQRLQWIEQRFAPPETKKDDGPRPPRREEYADPYEYADARVKYERDKFAAETQAVQKRQSETQKQRYLRQIEMSHAERVQEAFTKYDDMQEALDNVGYVAYDQDNPVHQELVTTLYELPQSGEMVYYFAKNPDEFNKLFELNPKAALIKLGQVATKIENQLNQGVINSSIEPPVQERSSVRGDTVSLKKEDFKDFRKKLFRKN